MTLIQLFLIHRYEPASVHYLTPTEDNQVQTPADEEPSASSRVVNDEIGQIIVADVDRDRVSELVRPDGEKLAEADPQAISQVA